MRCIAVVNQKGGVGKTTTAANLTHALAIRGFRVAAIDIDPQGHLTTYFGVNNRTTQGLDAVILDKQRIADLLQSVRQNVDLLAAGPKLADVERTHETAKIEGSFLKKLIAEQLSDYDFVILDCPPSSAFLMISALYTAKEVLIPVTGDYLGLHGMSHLIKTLKQFEKLAKHSIKQWVVLTRYHSRRRLANDVLERLQHYFPGSICDTKIRENTALAESPSFGQTIFEYKKDSHGAEDYSGLADDIVKGKAA